MSTISLVHDLGKRNARCVLLVDGIVKGVLIFPSISERILNIRGEEVTGNKSFLIKRNGMYFKVGECANNTFNYDANKDNEHSLNLIYTFASYFLNDGDLFNVYLGLPTNDYANEEIIERFRNLILKDGKEIFVDSYKDDKVMSKHFTINKINFFPEGLGLKERLAHKYRQLNIIDIGGYNINCRYYENGQQKKQLSLDKLGVNILKEELYDSIDKNLTDTRINLDSINLDEVIRERKVPGNFVEPQVLEFMLTTFTKERILESIQRKGFSV